MNLRPAKSQDAPTIAAIHVATWREAYRGLVPESHLSQLDPQRSADRFRAFIGSGQAESYLIESERTTVGFLTIGPSRDNDHTGEDVGEIWGLYLAPAHWRCGLGMRACRRAEEILRAKGFGPIVLWVFEGNASARRFYEAMGYRPDGGRKIIEVGMPLPAVRYRKDAPLRSAAQPEAG